ncbi:bifunctional alpha/beta hydrolase/class I SAM-dependent methyltransferase [Ignatzschineria sp. RMDPL8A]|uniref:bifunctional alpha/beta hydrolase/class I SAM-dependent methyltransferase n=1 Tax=Ignatzschineria sp. RMDPL8A TaxID=2999236 RepID=UPI0024466937|nr:bifunctional alpha/beta hydrolase/class I SAM-dependent methyltransferase [Ignatzschineria sp. RMDPL8A]MDG9728853.1 bifunctional alpha/beta hydrolase/class I SAM-dependent methyltransferase [Ignatzschineria sp. RMDPL8A]
MRQVTENRFFTYDGNEIFYRHWRANNGDNAAPAIVLFHRGHEHSGRIEHLVEEFNLPDFQFFAWDQRGLGLSEGARGDAESFAQILQDTECFMRHIKATHALTDNDIAVVGQSVGAVIAAGWVHDYVPKIRAMILGSPAFRIKLYVPFAIPGLRLMYNVRGNFYVNSYVKPSLLTHDTARIDSFKQDTLITRPISVRLLLDLHDSSKRLIDDADSIHVPTQLLVSGSDYVVRRQPQRQFFNKLSSAKKEFHLLPKFYHDTLGEKERHLAIEKARQFILDAFAEPLRFPSLLDADRIGVTKEELVRLQAPPKGLVKTFYWWMARRIVEYAKRISKGVELGFETGFDSGSTLDYIYKNEPQGEASFARFADFVYLNSIGWRGIRKRKDNAEQCLIKTIEALQKEGRAVRIMDVAAGHGRYILDGVNQLRVKPESILLRDYSELNIEKGRALIQIKGLHEIARFEKGDAFNREELATLPERATLTVVSGLYELFGDNLLVSNSLKGIYDNMESGGYLIYTAQPWHPQLEYIARVLTSHRNGKPWVMRRRTQIEMDQLVEAAGFEKIEQVIDRWGIFTVSIARKRPLC